VFQIPSSVQVAVYEIITGWNNVLFPSERVWNFDMKFNILYLSFTSTAWSPNSDWHNDKVVDF